MRDFTRDAVFTLAFVLLAIVCVRSVRAELFATNKDVRDKQDVYFLPPPEQVRVMSLGYRAAMADVLWAHVMVSQGLHTMQRRRFGNLLPLYDAINELDPTFRTPYLMADALITFQGNTTPYEEVVKAREIMERGTKNRPHDAEIWLNLGQFVSFVAPSSYLDDRPEEAARWRREGVPYLQRAAELAGSNSDVSWQAIGGANILAKAGELDAALRFWQRTYAVTDDEQLKEQITAKIERFSKELASERERLSFEKFAARDKVAKELMKRELPFVDKDTALVLGPPLRPARCAGRPSDQTLSDSACATSWLEWNRRYERTSR